MYDSDFGPHEQIMESLRNIYREAAAARKAAEDLRNWLSCLGGIALTVLLFKSCS